MTRTLPFISVGVRVVVNVESLNMVESVGNVVRHRVVPVVIQKAPGQYIVRWVPAISGEALAHAYQVALAKVAEELGCEKYLCYWCRHGEFLKHFDLEFYKVMKDKKLLLNMVDEKILKVAESIMMMKKEQKATLEEARKLEDAIVRGCIVEDLGGFLTTQGPVKRTSVFQFSWMIPTVDSTEAGAALLDNQFQVRHAPNAQTIAETTGWSHERAQPQSPYYVQVASAVYAFTFNIDLEQICKSSIDDSTICTDDDECGRRCRALIAIEALGRILEGWFGAKRSRNLPFLEYECVIGLVSIKPIVVYAPTARFNEFIESTLELAEKRGAKVIVFMPPEKWEKLKEKKSELVEKLSKHIVMRNTHDVSAFIEKLKKTIEELNKVKLSCPK